ncbi:hypothetical protein Tco_1270945, partial [Tanacetum coccineum]
PRGIFINQSKYALEMLKKYGLDQCDAVDIPMVGQSKLDEDPNGTLAKPTKKHLTAVKRVFRLLRYKTQYIGKCTVPRRKACPLVIKETKLADIFTKALAKERSKFLINRLGMQSITPEELKRLAESDEE